MVAAVAMIFSDQSLLLVPFMIAKGWFHTPIAFSEAVVNKTAISIVTFSTKRVCALNFTKRLFLYLFPYFYIYFHIFIFFSWIITIISRPCTCKTTPLKSSRNLARFTADWNTRHLTQWNEPYSFCTQKIEAPLGIRKNRRPNDTTWGADKQSSSAWYAQF